jgi:hypothetical protein
MHAWRVWRPQPQPSGRYLGGVVRRTAAHPEDGVARPASSAGGRGVLRTSSLSAGGISPADRATRRPRH